MVISWNKIAQVKRFDIVLAVMTLIAMGGLTGCEEMYQGTYITPNRIQIEDNRVALQRPAEDVDQAFLDDVAKTYAKQGVGPLNLRVTYDPASKTNTSMKASTTVSQIAGVLRRYGVNKLDASVMPVEQSGAVSDVFIGFDAYTAKPPEDCADMGGMQSREIGNIQTSKDYKLGCTLDTVFTKQVARPKDLAGHDVENTDTDGRRSARVIETYRSTENKALSTNESSTGGN